MDVASFLKSLNGAVQSTAPANESPQRAAARLFSHEGPDLYAAAIAHNAAFAKPGPYQTKLTPKQEADFRVWVSQNKIPFDPTAKTVDYDMRGFWLSKNAAGAQGRAANGHFPDTFKTPFDTTFSGESLYAIPGAPFKWVGNTLVDTRTGKTIYSRGG